MRTTCSSVAPSAGGWPSPAPTGRSSAISSVGTTVDNSTEPSATSHTISALQPASSTGSNPSSTAAGVNQSRFSVAGFLSGAVPFAVT